MRTSCRLASRGPASPAPRGEGPWSATVLTFANSSSPSGTAQSNPSSLTRQFSFLSLHLFPFSNLFVLSLDGLENRKKIGKF
ncbi:hypothetical protein Acr_00g0098460 [Actinidia rufa]|uniref:Uncharacterized protein n=1 Tax=Actinidia rufa TaxID=165716 RepID=A0A7J0DZC4_9ERIC|nr:hypothetical protein Acr_00g0098460 [Actinidia rufa]